MQLIYPSSPLRLRQPDEHYADEVEDMRKAGFNISFFSFEELQSEEFRVSAQPESGTFLYRGWMLNADEYERLASGLLTVGAHLAVPCSEYLANHHLPQWYPLVSDLTPETRVYSLDCDLEAELQKLNWAGFFIKDYVKSLKTSVGSRISSPAEVSALISEMKRFRGTIEGGYCVRRLETFLPESERRFFIIDGKPYGMSEEVPDIVRECAKRLKSRFVSVDVIKRSDGQLRIVEIGDGQVSDLVGWQPDRFSKILAMHFL